MVLVLILINIPTTVHIILLLQVVAGIMMYFGVVFLALPVAVLSANFEDMLNRHLEKLRIEDEDMNYINQGITEEEKIERIKILQNFYNSMSRQSSIFITTATNQRFVLNRKISGMH